MPEWQFPSVQELDAYQRCRREERIDASVSEFLTQLHNIAQLPLAELSGPPRTCGEADPTSVMDTLPDLD
tara:strand:+ start:177 stop:386 length:210 start_codon:yes stop_codon:yes gene_type:complete